MMLFVLQITVVVAVAAYLYRWRVGVRRQNAQSWDSILARLRPDWNVATLRDLCVKTGWRNGSLRDKWRHIRDAHGLWAMYQNAGVMLELAAYAARNSDAVDRELLAALHSDAMTIRVCVLKTIAEYAIGTVTEAVTVNALRAESAYAGMVLTMTSLLETNAGEVLPAFVATM